MPCRSGSRGARAGCRTRSAPCSVRSARRWCSAGPSSGGCRGRRSAARSCSMRACRRARARPETSAELCGSWVYTGRAMNGNANLPMIVLGAVGLVLVLLMLYMVPLRLWIAAKAAGASVGMLTLVAMRLRRVPPDTIVAAYISAVKAGLEIQVDLLEAHYLAGGRVEAVVNALISADKAGMNL